MKRTYFKPETNVLNLAIETTILAGSGVKFDENGDINAGGGAEGTEDDLS